MSSEGEHTMKYKGKWIVHVKGAYDREHEISVLREDNEFGKKSYGWFGENKIWITTSFHFEPVEKEFFDKLVLSANKVAEVFNKE